MVTSGGSETERMEDSGDGESSFKNEDGDPTSMGLERADERGLEFALIVATGKERCCWGGCWWLLPWWKYKVGKTENFVRKV